MSVYYRVDDRLIHGQVITSWSKYYDLNSIYIVDDDVAKDPIQTNIIEMVAPSHLQVDVLNEKEAADKIKDVTGNTLILVKFPETILNLKNNGIEIEEIILGGMQFKEGREKITKSISISQKQRKELQKLIDNNTEIYVQMIPSEKRRNLKTLL